MKTPSRVGLRVGSAPVSLFAVAIPARHGQIETDAPADALVKVLAVCLKLLDRLGPAPAPRVGVMHDQQVLQLLDLGKAVAVRVGDGAIEAQVRADVAMPALHERPAQVRAGRLEVQDHVDAARTFERPIDEVDRAIGGEDVDDAFLDADAVESGEKNGLVFGFVDPVAVAQGDVHIVEEDDAAALDGEESAHGLFRIAAPPRLPIGVGRDNAILPAATAALVPDPAAGHRLAVARSAREQDAAPRPAAEGANLLQPAAFQVADRVFPEDVGVGRGQDGRLARRLGILQAALGDAVKPAIVAPLHRQEVDRCIIDFEAVHKLDDGETDALDIVDAAAEANAGIGLARARTPVVNDDAVDGKGAAAARRFQERPVMRVGRERHRIGKTRFARNNLQDLAVSGGVTREREHTFRTTAARKGSGDFSGRDRDCAANLCKAHSLPPRCTMRRWLFWILLLAGFPLFHLLEHLHVYADTPEGDADLIIHNAKVVTV